MQSVALLCPVHIRLDETVYLLSVSFDVSAVCPRHSVWSDHVGVVCDAAWKDCGHAVCVGVVPAWSGV